MSKIKTGLIPARNAAIIYNLSRESNHKTIDYFKVYFHPYEDDWDPAYFQDDLDFQDHHNKLAARYKHLHNCSFGTFNSLWHEIDTSRQITWALLPFFRMDEAFASEKLKQQALFELGKIKEFEAIRHMYLNVYLNREPLQMTYDGLMQSIYAYDFCDGH